MDINTDFKDDFIEKYSEKEYKDVDSLIDKCLEDPESQTLEKGQWEASCMVEKINQLQYIYYISLTKKDEEISLEYENGINNGTVLTDYDFTGRWVSAHKYVEVLHDIVIDWDEVNSFGISRTGKKPRKDVVEALFAYNKSAILSIYSNQNYDNYVTGGGTNITDKAYREQKEEYNNKGLFWTLVDKIIEVDRNFV